MVELMGEQKFEEYSLREFKLTNTKVNMMIDHSGIEVTNFCNTNLLCILYHFFPIMHSDSLFHFGLTKAPTTVHWKQQNGVTTELSHRKCDRE